MSWQAVVYCLLHFFIYGLNQNSKSQLDPNLGLIYAACQSIASNTKTKKHEQDHEPWNWVSLNFTITMPFTHLSFIDNLLKWDHLQSEWNKIKQNKKWQVCL